MTDRKETEQHKSSDTAPARDPKIESTDDVDEPADASPGDASLTSLDPTGPSHITPPENALGASPNVPPPPVVVTCTRTLEARVYKLESEEEEWVEVGTTLVSAPFQPGGYIHYGNDKGEIVRTSAIRTVYMQVAWGDAYAPSYTIETENSLYQVWTSL
jgi:hypothetical protein